MAQRILGVLYEVERISSLLASMEMFFQSVESVRSLLVPVLGDIRFQLASLIVLATIHGYAGAWHAVRMVFRPRLPVRFWV